MGPGFISGFLAGAVCVLFVIAPYLGDPLAPTNVATRKYQIWVSLFPGGNFLAKFSYKFLHRWSCTQTAQIALEYYSHTMGVWKSIY